MGSRLPSRLLQHANATQLFQTDCRHSSRDCAVFLREIKHQVTLTHIHTRYITTRPAERSERCCHWVCATLRLVRAELSILTGIHRKKGKTENRSHGWPEYKQTLQPVSKFPCFHLSLSTQKSWTKKAYLKKKTKSTAIYNARPLDGDRLRRVGVRLHIWNKENSLHKPAVVLPPVTKSLHDKTKPLIKSLISSKRPSEPGFYSVAALKKKKKKEWWTFMTF